MTRHWLVLVAVLAFTGCSHQSPVSSTSTSSPKSRATNAVPSPSSAPSELIAGTEERSPYRPFTQTAYDQALAAGKVIFLDFYANWCPICRAEAPELAAGFDAFESAQLVGFRVNYNDDETDADERSLARQFGITYQHTKVVLKGGSEVLRDLNAWQRTDVVDRLTPLLQ